MLSLPDRSIFNWQQRFLCRLDFIFNPATRIHCSGTKGYPIQPEYAGQLNFYINVVDDKLRGKDDNKTIGLLLCKGKDEVVAQYALTGYDQPIGISDYQLSKAIPENLKSILPSIEEVEEEPDFLS